MIKNLKNLRLEKGISQNKLAEIIGTSQQSINKYENHNIEPDINTLTALADYFSTSVDYLIGHSDIRHKIEAVTPFDLNEDEATLINAYRQLTSPQKESLHLIIKKLQRKKLTPTPRKCKESVCFFHFCPKGKNFTRSLVELHLP